MKTISYGKETKASKDHKCDFCGEKIFKGIIYIKSTHEFDGQIYDWKTHDYCSKLASKLNMYDDADEGVTQDMFMEIVGEKHDDILIGMLPENEIQKYGDIVRQIRHVRFRDKLSYVLRHFAKQEKEKNKTEGA